MIKKILFIIVIILSIFLFKFIFNKNNDFKYKFNNEYIDLEKIGNKYILKDNKRKIELIDAEYKNYKEIKLKPKEFSDNDDVDKYLKVFQTMQKISDFYLKNFNYKLNTNLKVIVNVDKNNSYSFLKGVIALGNKSYYLSDSVLMHEYTHLVIEDILNIIDTNESKIIKEAYCDVISSIYTDKWIIGDEDNIIRNIENPYLTNNSIKLNDEYYDKNKIHNNSTIISHIAYVMYKDEIVKDKMKLAKIWYDSLYLLNDLNYISFSNALIESCRMNNIDEDKINKLKNIIKETNII